MTQEEKELLLKDLCARLPYGITIYRITDNSIHHIQYSDITENIDQFSHFLEYSGVDNIKPYLRPMSSMTEEEYNELRKLLDVNTCRHSSCGEPHKTTFGIDVIAIESYNPNLTKYVPILINMIPIAWLNEHHFDYRGLIEKGLALEAPEGMYN